MILRKTYIIGTLIIGVMTFFLTQHTSSTHKNYVDPFSQALQAWESDDLETAAMLLGNNPEAYLNREHGCELCISVFAKLHEYEKVEEISKQCLDKTPMIALEGHTYSLSFQGKFDEALQALQSFKGHDKLSTTEQARINIMFGKVHALKGEYQNSITALLEITSSPLQQQAIYMIIQFLRQSKDPQLLARVRQQLSTQPEQLTSFEEKWSKNSKIPIETKNPHNTHS